MKILAIVTGTYAGALTGITGVVLLGAIHPVLIAVAAGAFYLLKE